MAAVDSITVNLSAKTGAATAVLAMAYPLVRLGLLSPERAAGLAMRFVTVDIVEAPTPEQLRRRLAGLDNDNQAHSA